MAQGFSKLDAVNIVLSGIGETPVSSLSSGLPDAESAERALDETSRDIQEKGWHCNTEKVTLKRSSTAGTVNQILLPGNTLKVDTTDEHDDVNVAQRGSKLYNLDDATYEFDKDLKVEIVYNLDFDDLPYRLAYYIAWVAAGRYQMREMGSSAIAEWIQAEIIQAKAALDDSEEFADDANVLRDSKSVRQVAYRNSYRRWR